MGIWEMPESLMGGAGQGLAAGGSFTGILQISPARPQDLTFTAHLLVLTKLLPHFSFKLSSPAYLLIQAKDPAGISSPLETETTSLAVMNTLTESSG